MRRMLMVLLGAAAILLGGLLVAGCGGSDNDAAATTTAAETSTTETTAGSTSEDETASTSDEEMTDSVASPAGLGEDCQELSELGQEFSKAMSAAGADGSDETDLKAAAEAYEEFADKAPEEIRDAFKTLGEAFAVYAEALQGIDLSSGETPDPATIAKIAKAAEGLNSAELTEANTEITTWITENCSTGG